MYVCHVGSRSEAELDILQSLSGSASQNPSWQGSDRKFMIESMFLGIFAGMLSCIIALLLNHKSSYDQHMERDESNALAKTCMYLLTTTAICFCAVFEIAIGGLAVSVYTLFGMIAFVLADEFVNSSLFGRLADETE